MNGKKKFRLDELEVVARQLLSQRAGTIDLTLFSKASETPDPEGIDYYYFAANRSSERNGETFPLYLEESGEERTPEYIAGRYGKKIEEVFFAVALSPAVITPIATPARPTISPASNEFVLEQGCTFEELIQVCIPPKFQRKVDVYFLFDLTGSMGTFVNAVKASAINIINGLDALGDFAFGVASYKDFSSNPSYPNEYGFQNEQSITNSNVLTVNAINNLSIGNGGDWPEAQLYGLHQSAKNPSVNWRSGAKRIIVWMGDAPGHDPVPNLFTSLGIDLTETGVINALVDENVTVIAMNLRAATGGLNDDPSGSNQQYPAVPPPAGGPGQAKNITDATSGALINGVNSSNVVTEILNAVATETSTIDRIELVPTGGITGLVDIVNPTYFGPVTLGEEQCFNFEVIFKGNKKCQERDQVFTGSLTVMADGEPIAAKKVEIRVPACCDCEDACTERQKLAEKKLLEGAGNKQFSIDALMQCERSGVARCPDIVLPNLRPCFYLRWGDSAGDQFESHDQEVVYFQVCNPYRNLRIRGLHIYGVELVGVDGSSVPKLPDGNPTALISPSEGICIKSLEPCSCIAREFVLNTQSLPAGNYTIRFKYCIDTFELTECLSGLNGFEITVVKD